MKKLMVVASALMLAAAAQADCRWSWWVGGPDKDAKISGCQLGIASECKEVKGAQVSLLWGRLERALGFQGAIGYSRAKKVVNGPQIAVVNVAEEGAALQFGLLNWNKKGFLPFFPFFNFSKACFGNPDKK